MQVHRAQATRGTTPSSAKPILQGQDRGAYHGPEAAVYKPPDPSTSPGASGYQMGVGSGSYEPRMSHPEIKDQPRIEPLDSLNSCNGLNGYIKTQNY